MSRSSTLTLSIADAQDRLSIYAARHLVYASELGQHPETPDGVLTDILDEVNTYLVAKRDDQVVGFVAITPPNRRGYSVDKYFAREDMPFRGDEDPLRGALAHRREIQSADQSGRQSRSRQARL